MGSFPLIMPKGRWAACLIKGGGPEASVGTFQGGNTSVTAPATWRLPQMPLRKAQATPDREPRRPLSLRAVALPSRAFLAAHISRAAHLLGAGQQPGECQRDAQPPSRKSASKSGLVPVGGSQGVVCIMILWHMGRTHAPPSVSANQRRRAPHLLADCPRERCTDVGALPLSSCLSTLLFPEGQKCP